MTQEEKLKRAHVLIRSLLRFCHGYVRLAKGRGGQFADLEALIAEAEKFVW